ncbi:MAG: hypothetical protein H6597_04155 [Flavobacteriales bacterium]|nr:hypothetical protein [Flavobacteriales bacterium]
MHLLRRTLFGVTPADLAHFDGMALTQVVDELLTFNTNVPSPIKACGTWTNAVDGRAAQMNWGRTPRRGSLPDCRTRLSLA